MGRRRVILPLVALLASACAVGPDYQQPKIAVEDSYGPAATQPAATAPAVAAVNAAWWRAFNDPRLDQLIAAAAAGNLDLQQAQARIRAARSLRAVVAGADLPALNADAAYQRDRLSKNAAPYNAFDLPMFPWEFNTYSAGFDASWEIDLFGGTRRAVEAAGANTEAAQQARAAVLVTLQAEVARNYVELRGYQQQRALAEHNLELQQQTLDLTRNRAQHGVGSDLDVIRAAALVATTAAEIPLFERGQWQALHRLAVLTHLPLARLEDLLQAAPIPSTSQYILVGVPAELLRRRPDILQAERQLAAATAQIGAAQAELYPKLSLTGVFNLQSASLSDFADWRSKAYSLGPTVSWPLFQGGRLRAAVDVRRAQQQEALLNYEQKVDAAIEDVRNQAVTLSSERNRRSALAEAVAQDRDAAELAGKLYAQGLTDFLTVLDAQRQLNSAENALARSDAQLDVALIGLYKALGGGWQVEQEPGQGGQETPANPNASGAR